jgi:hypothetical protein
VIIPSGIITINATPTNRPAPKILIKSRVHFSVLIARGRIPARVDPRKRKKAKQNNSIMLLIKLIEIK